MEEKEYIEVPKPIRYSKISIPIYTNASLEGWGVFTGIVFIGGA